MQYWDNYHKFGFDDGAYAPPDVNQVRQIQCHVLNAVAKKIGSNCRVRPYNRTGTHNMYIVLIISEVAYDAWDNDPFSDVSDDDIMEPDDKWNEAFGIANEILEYIEPDIITVEVTVHQDKLDAVLNGIDDKSIFEEIDPYFIGDNL